MLSRLTRWFIPLALLLAACDPILAPYSVEAYRSATELKARSLALIAQSGESYAGHSDKAVELMTDIDAAYEFARGLPRNDITAAQWQILRDPEAGLMGDFVALWKRQGTVGAFFRQEKAGQIAAAFDYIICLEINKRAAFRCDGGQDGI